MNAKLDKIESVEVSKAFTSPNADPDAETIRKKFLELSLACRFEKNRQRQATPSAGRDGS